MFNKSWAMKGGRLNRILVWSTDGAEEEIPQSFSPPIFQSPVGASTDQLNHKPKSNGEHTVQHVEVRFLWLKAEQRKAGNGLVWKRQQQMKTDPHRGNMFPLRRVIQSVRDHFWDSIRKNVQINWICKYGRNEPLKYVWFSKHYSSDPCFTISLFFHLKKNY